MRKYAAATALAIALNITMPALAVSPLPNNAGCEILRYRFNDDGESSTTMYASRNAVCRLAPRIIDAHSGDAGILSSTVTTKPKLGKLEKTTARQFAYVANKDVTGDDYFAIDFRYDRHEQRHRTTLAVTVHIEPSRASIRPRGEAMRDEYGIARSGGRGSSLQCAGALRCSCRVQCGDTPVGKPSPDIAACMEKCVKAKEAAQR
jgi:hypothetical protein